jgi:hypothetical protein
MNNDSLTELADNGTNQHSQNIKKSNNNLFSCFKGEKFQEAVESVINQACKLLNAETAGVMLFDEQKQELILQMPAFGEKNGHKIDIYRVPIDGKGVGISVFRSGIPYISNDPAGDPLVLQHIVEAYPSRNLITIPLEYNSRRIGVLHVTNKKDGDFGQADLDLLNLISHHITLLLENSVHYEVEKKHAAELAKSYDELEQQQQRLQRLTEIHGKLVRSILNGEGLPAIITTLAELLNCQVMVEDKHYNLVCGAKNGISQEYSEIDYQRVLVPLMDKYSILGYLSVLFNHKILDEFDEIAIEQTALIASLELVKDKNVAEIETKLKTELIDDIIYGSSLDNERLLSRARYLNYDLSPPQSVAVIRITTKKGEEKNEE